MTALDPVVTLPAELDVQERLAGPITVRMSGWLALAATGGLLAGAHSDPVVRVIGAAALLVGVVAAWWCPGQRPLLSWAFVGCQFLRRTRARTQSASRFYVLVPPSGDGGVSTRRFGRLHEWRIGVARRVGRARHRTPRTARRQTTDVTRERDRGAGLIVRAAAVAAIASGLLAAGAAGFAASAGRWPWQPPAGGQSPGQPVPAPAPSVVDVAPEEVADEPLGCLCID